MIICLLGVTLRYEDICEPGMHPAVPHAPAADLRLLASLPARLRLALPQRQPRHPHQPQLRRRTHRPHRRTPRLRRRSRLQLSRRSRRPPQPAARLSSRTTTAPSPPTAPAAPPRSPSPASPNWPQLVGAPVGAVYVHPQRAWHTPLLGPLPHPQALLPRHRRLAAPSPPSQQPFKPRSTAPRSPNPTLAEHSYARRWLRCSSQPRFASVRSEDLLLA